MPQQGQLATAAQSQQAAVGIDADIAALNIDKPAPTVTAQQQSELRSHPIDLDEQEFSQLQTYSKAVKSRVPAFDGKYEESVNWLRLLETVLEDLRIPQRVYANVMVSLFRGKASTWYMDGFRESLEKDRTAQPRPQLSYPDLKAAFQAKFKPPADEQVVFRQLFKLRQGARAVKDFGDEFQAVARRTFVDQNTLKMQFQEALDPATRCENSVAVAPSPVTTLQLLAVPHFSDFGQVEVSGFPPSPPRLEPEEGAENAEPCPAPVQRFPINACLSGTVAQMPCSACPEALVQQPSNSSIAVQQHLQLHAVLTEQLPVHAVQTEQSQVHVVQTEQSQLHAVQTEQSQLQSGMCQHGPLQTAVAVLVPDGIVGTVCREAVRSFEFDNEGRKIDTLEAVISRVANEAAGRVVAPSSRPQPSNPPARRRADGDAGMDEEGFVTVYRKKPRGTYAAAVAAPAPAPVAPRALPNPPRAPKADPPAGPPNVRVANVRDSNGITFDQGYKHPLPALGASVDVAAMSLIRPPVCFRCAQAGHRASDREACQQLINFRAMGKV